MKTLHAGLLVFVVLKLVGAVPLASFYTFGSSAGDTTLHRNDDGSSSLISLSTAFPYFGTNHRAVYVRAVQNYAVYAQSILPHAGNNYAVYIRKVLSAGS